MNTETTAHVDETSRCVDDAGMTHAHPAPRPHGYLDGEEVTADTDARHAARETAAWFWTDPLRAMARDFAHRERVLAAGLFRIPEMERFEQIVGDLTCSRCGDRANQRVGPMPAAGGYVTFVCRWCNRITVVDVNDHDTRKRLRPPRNLEGDDAVRDLEHLAKFRRVRPR